ncbi:MAG: bifunctional nuclease family protein [Spirochaetaceae bacterium]|nr:bifunctional nuclease family protein [Spirochaetaceae bacterium]
MDTMLESEIWSIARIDQGNAVLLRPLGMDLVVPIFIGSMEVHAILLGLGSIKAKRPLSCDLFLEMSHQLGITLSKIEVHEIREDIFRARIFLCGREFSPSKPLIIDSRPSDAFALAIREKCPVFMASKVLERAGIPADIFAKEGNAAGRIPPLIMGEETDRAGAGLPKKEKTPKRITGEAGHTLAAKRRQLQAELETAVEKENYERAAEIRDLLILLDQQIEQERRGKETP